MPASEGGRNTRQERSAPPQHRYSSVWLAERITLWTGECTGKNGDAATVREEDDPGAGCRGVRRVGIIGASPAGKDARLGRRPLHKAREAGEEWRADAIPIVRERFAD
jgi:hypothetical protein